MDSYVTISSKADLIAKIYKGVDNAIPLIASDLAFDNLLKNAAAKGEKIDGVLHTFTGKMKDSIRVSYAEGGAYDVIIDVPYAIDFEEGNWRDEFLMVNGQLTPLGEWFKDPEKAGWSDQKIRANKEVRVGHPHPFLAAAIWRQIDKATDRVREQIVLELERP